MNSSFNNEVKLSKKMIMPTPYGSIPKRTKKQSSKKSSAVTTVSRIFNIEGCVQISIT